MKKNLLLGALPIIAHALGRQRGIQVRIGGSRAFTDFQTITIPALPPDDQQAAILANGYIDHESGHIRHTDPACLKPPGWVGVLLNLFEDIRVEQALSRAYPGSRHNLAALVAALEADSPSLPAPEAPLPEQLMVGLWALLRTRVLGQTALAATAAVMEARLASRLSDAVWNPLRALAFEVQSALSTQDALALAEAVVQLLAQAVSAAADNAPAPEEDHPDTTAATGDQDAPTASGLDGTDEAGVQARVAPGVETSSNGVDDYPPASATITLTARQHHALTTLLATAPSVPAADVGARAAALLHTQAASTDAHRVTMASYESPPPHPAAHALPRDVRAATAALRRRLAYVVQARCQATTVVGRRGRRLAGAALYRLTVGDPRLFCRRIDGETLDTAISVLLDRSGSMVSEMMIASRAVLALALALDELAGVACQVAAFPGEHEGLMPLKEINERARRVAGRFELKANGTTPLAAALWRVAFDLTLRPVARRCVVVITDGQPDDSVATRDIIARCRQSGIEVVGLGIGLSLSQLQAVFGAAEAQSIDHIQDVAPALFDLLAQRLAVAA